MLGSQEPSARICPEYRETDGGDAVRILAAGGFILDDWQADILADWMARTPADRWACPTCGLSVPRQNGKTALISGRIESGMLLFREQVLYTAHLQKTATETFEEIAAFFDQPKMRKHLKDIKTALGREQVILTNGARVKFLARTRNGGRGQHGDLWIVDEAQCLDSDGQASFLPAISASINPQAIYVGTPPDPNEQSDVFRRMRSEALAGSTKRMSWTEYSVDEIGDIHDSARWFAANPALGRRIQLSTVEGEMEQMPPDTFARERLGWWADVKQQGERVFNEEEWTACAIAEPNRDGLATYAVKFSPDGATAALACCYKSGNDSPLVYIVEHRSMSGGLSWFVDKLLEHQDEAAQIVIDGQGNAQTLNDKLLERGMSKKLIIRPKTAEAIAAYAALANAVTEQQVTHYNQPGLNDSATKSIKRPIGSHGGWGFASTDEADSTLIESAALAYWAAMTTKRKPGRKAVVF